MKEWFGMWVCLFRGHIWTAKGKLDGAYCARCGQWEYDR